MTVLKRRRRSAPGEAPEVGAPPPVAAEAGSSSEFAVAAFEYVEVESTALARLTGTWSGDRGAPVDMRLVLTLPQGGERDEVEGLAEGARTGGGPHERAGGGG